MFTKLSHLSMFTALMLAVSATTCFASGTAYDETYTAEKDFADIQHILLGEKYTTVDPSCVQDKILENKVHKSLISMGAKLNALSIHYSTFENRKFVEVLPGYEYPASFVFNQQDVETPFASCELK